MQLTGKKFNFISF